MAAFEAARFNHSRTSPHQRQPNCRSAASVFDGRQDRGSAFSLANALLSVMLRRTLPGLYSLLKE
jgi:hypothetical protein